MNKADKTTALVASAAHQRMYLDVTTNEVEQGIHDATQHRARFALSIEVVHDPFDTEEIPPLPIVALKHNDLFFILDTVRRSNRQEITLTDEKELLARRLLASSRKMRKVIGLLKAHPDWYFYLHLTSSVNSEVRSRLHRRPARTSAKKAPQLAMMPVFA